ncbi:hypothetical protein OsI_28777 [Oryza sativa Indica Group]|uniref:NPH3 domain-containing protein n=1 Tax=Oryza sativa subsp. indica TaxID=39946 RepID=A2YTX0_ORYSI|nr:hypothetical protein OsI_28777 [Oryza sativa Indica Group]
MVGANASLLLELESMVARRLDQATLGVVMIPCTALLDVPLVMCLVRGFLKDGEAADGLKCYDLVEGKGPTAVKGSIVQDASIGFAQYVQV